MTKEISIAGREASHLPAFHQTTADAQAYVDARFTSGDKVQLLSRGNNAGDAVLTAA